MYASLEVNGLVKRAFSPTSISKAMSQILESGVPDGIKPITNAKAVNLQSNDQFRAI